MSESSYATFKSDDVVCAAHSAKKMHVLGRCSGVGAKVVREFQDLATQRLNTSISTANARAGLADKPVSDESLVSVANQKDGATDLVVQFLSGLVWVRVLMVAKGVYDALSNLKCYSSDKPLTVSAIVIGIAWYVGKVAWRSEGKHIEDAADAIQVDAQAARALIQVHGGLKINPIHTHEAAVVKDVVKSGMYPGSLEKQA